VSSSLYLVNLSLANVLELLLLSPPFVVQSDPSAPKKKTRAQLEAEYVERFEERFGGGSQSQLGELVDGKPQGQARNVQRNMFRLI
jgi:hypothetical protein